MPAVAAPPRTQSPATSNDTPFAPASPAPAEPDEKSKSEKKSAAPKTAAPKADDTKAGAQKKSAKGEAKGEAKDDLYRQRGSEPVGGLPRLVPGDYKRHDPNAIPDTPTPSGVIMSPNP